jgi:ATP-dependent RNA helicase DeaD
MITFESLGLSPATLETLKRKGFEEPTTIQARAIPLMLKGSADLIGQARTGTGKTAAFGLPMIEILSESSKSTQALVLTPTRELAIQVAEEIYSLKGKKNLKIVPVYGGQSIDLQLKSLRRGVDIVVGTPGRVLDHLNRGSLKLDAISFFVLDEADEMLNMGFLEDVEKIMRAANPRRRTMLFSATMPAPILAVARKYMADYEIVKVVSDSLTSSKTSQIYFEVAERDKFEALCRIIDMEEEFYGIVFCRTKVDVDRVSGHLGERAYQAAALHGDISQALREKILAKFKKREVTILVATDVAARGIDVQDISHVINYALPYDPEAYVHRIGRTGRAGKTGTAVTFITPSEYRKLEFIRQKARTDIRRQTLPKVKDIIMIKKRRIKAYLEELQEATVPPEYMDLAIELLAGRTPEAILGALLQHSFQGELSESSYREIDDAVIDMKGKTRLFVTMGRADGLTQGKLSAFLQDKCGINTGKIQNMDIRDRFSFISLPFHEAELVLAHFRTNRKKTGMLITKARPPERGAVRHR